MPPIPETPENKQEGLRNLLLKKILEEIGDKTLSREELEKTVVDVLVKEDIEKKEGINIFLALKGGLISRLREKIHTDQQPQPKKMYDIIPPTTPKNTKPPAKPWWKADDDKPELKKNEDGTYTQIREEK